jgi:hypothetical protein
MRTSAIFLLGSVLALLHAAVLAAAPPRAEILFRLANPCPATGQTSGACNGYVIDRIVPPVCGGAEDPSNMQWQTLSQAKEKDRWERIGCRAGRKQVMPSNETYTEAYPLRDAPVAAEVQAQPLQ